MNYVSAPRADGYSRSRDCGGDHELESLAALDRSWWRYCIGIRTWPRLDGCRLSTLSAGPPEARIEYIVWDVRRKRLALPVRRRGRPRLAG